MPVICPYCENPLSLKVKGAKPGKYTTGCPKCARKFQLAIPDDPQEEPKVSALKEERARNETAPAPADAEDDPNATAALPRTEVATSGDVAATAMTRKRPEGVPNTLGGYQVLEELGRGGMGAVYLARQVSLNRNVALKVMKPEWARNATFVARFTREAYAAAQLNHHNVVQIYDFGEDGGTAYFSMEFVQGQTLAGLLKQKTRLDVEEAVGYVLQAARGLKYAHDQSMIHRDVKPENLLVNAQGVVKVADLGLVKTPEFAEAEAVADAQAAKGAKPVGSPSAADWASVTGSSQITNVNVAMGTPAFMAPEQARDAANVDNRADIYSLGCTLYDLVTGRPPFEGRTAMEVITKHQTEAITPPDLVAKRVPKELSAIILKMTAKDPRERYGDLADVIRDLEKFLGVSAAAAFTPKEEHANLLEENARAYAASPSAKIRKWVIPGLLLSCLLLAVLLVLRGRPIVAGGILGFGVLTALADFVIVGARRGSYLFEKVRALVLTSSIGDWLMGAVGVLVLAVGLYVFGLFWVWILFGVAAVMVAIGIQTALDKKVDAERGPAVSNVEGLLRSMRLQGLDEDALRQFVCKYSGERWEEFFEELFGYEAKLEARARWGHGDRAKARSKFGAWREPVVAWIDAKIQERRAAKERAKLQAIEEKGLCAQGENLVTARRKAHRAAEAMVTMASELKHSQAATRRDNTIAVNHGIAQAMREAATQPEKVLVHREEGLVDEKSSLVATILAAVLGARTRFIAGALLLGGCLVWMHQNEMLTSEHAQTVADTLKSVKGTDLKDLTAAAGELKEKVADIAGQAKAKTETKSLSLPMVPLPVLALVSSFGAGASGLILLFSSFFRGAKMTIFALPAAGITLFGPKLMALGLPRLGGLDDSLVPVVIGCGIMVVGIFLGRTRE